MHTNVILTNKRRTRVHTNYTNTKRKAWFRRLLRHPVTKRNGPILHSRTHTGVDNPKPGVVVDLLLPSMPIQSNFIGHGPSPPSSAAYGRQRKFQPILRR